MFRTSFDSSRSCDICVIVLVKVQRRKIDVKEGQVNLQKLQTKYIPLKIIADFFSENV